MPDIRKANGLAVWIQDEQKMVVWDAPNEAWVEVGAEAYDDAAIQAKVDEHIAAAAAAYATKEEVNAAIQAHSTDITSVRESISTRDEWFGDIRDSIESVETRITDLDTEDYMPDDRDLITTAVHGGLPIGTNVKGWSVKRVLDWILFPASLPSLKAGGTQHVLVDPGLKASLEASFSFSEGRDISMTDNWTIDIGGSTFPLKIGDIEGIKMGHPIMLSSYVDIKDRFTQSETVSVTITAQCDTVDDTSSKAYGYSGKVLTATQKIDLYQNVYFGTTATPDDYANAVGNPDNYPSKLSFLGFGELNHNQYLTGGGARALYADSTTVTLPFAAFSEKYMAFSSIRTVKTIKDPNGFDISSSFRQVRFAACDWPGFTGGEDFYVYIALNKSTQSNPYPLTVKFH